MPDSAHACHSSPNLTGPVCLPSVSADQQIMPLLMCWCRVDPFSADSPIKQLEIQHFPPDVFFVLRVVQLLRGLSGGMQVRPCQTLGSLVAC